MRTAMLAIRRSVPCNLRRIAACVAGNKIRTRLARRCNESNLLSASSPNVADRRIYSTESDPEPRVLLPMLVAGSDVFKPSILLPFRFFFLSHTTIPHIDKEFVISDTLMGIRYAITVISKALASSDYDSLEGLVAEDMIEVLRTKIETLSPEQRELIAINEEDIVFEFLCDVIVDTGEEHSIQIKIICHYTPYMVKKKMTQDIATAFSKLGDLLICNYTFARKYVNNIGGPWIATFVNHYSINVIS